MKGEVYFVRCEDYESGFEEALARLWRLAGWPGEGELTGKKVLVKPNLLTDRRPDQAVTTHPAVVRGVVRLLKTRGASVVVGDSPASVANIESVWRLSGLGEVCAAEGVPLIALEHEGAQTFERGGFNFSIARPVLEADLIVNLPKVKSHSLTALTAAVKNIYGTIPGYTKTLLHRQHHKLHDFGALIRTLWEVMPPTLSLADGVVGMEGQGPANGKPVKLGFLAASRDPFALDRALCAILRIDTRRVPYLITPSAGEQVAPELLGDHIESLNFKVPSGGHLLNLLPGWLVRNAGGLIWVRPSFSAAACVRCGLCVKACPVHALSLPPGVAVPTLDAKLCISCSCCHEVCPHDAVRMRQAPALRLLKVFKGMD